MGPSPKSVVPWALLYLSPLDGVERLPRSIINNKNTAILIIVNARLAFPPRVPESFGPTVTYGLCM